MLFERTIRWCLGKGERVAPKREAQRSHGMSYVDIIKGHYRKNIIVYVTLRGFVVIISVPHWNSMVFLNQTRGTKKGGPSLARNELDIIKGHYRKNIIVYVILRGFVVIISVPHWNSIVFLNQK